MNHKRILVLGVEGFARRLAEGLSFCGQVEVIPWSDGSLLWSLEGDAGGIQVVIRETDQDHGKSSYRGFKGDYLVLAMNHEFVLPIFAEGAFKLDPRVVSLADLSFWLGIDYLFANSNTELNPIENLPRRTAIIIDSEGLEAVISTRAALLCAEELIRRGSEVAVFYRSLALGGGENDLYYNRARESGVRFIQYQERPTIEPGSDERISLGFIDVSLSDRFQLKLLVDLLVLAEEYQYSTTQRELFQRLGWDRYLGGHQLNLNNLHYWGYNSPRRSFYWVTAEVWREQLEAVIDSIENQAFQSSSPDFVKPALVVDPYRCQLCLTCRRVCPHGAIEIADYPDRREHGMMYQAAARIQPERCFGCGICQHECPALAIERTTEPSDLIILGIGAGKQLLSLDKTGLIDAPIKLTAFACLNSGYLAAKEIAAESEQIRNYQEFDWKAEIKVRPVNCAGDISVLDIWRELSEGADGIIVWGCHPGACQHLWGNQRIKQRWSTMRTELRTALVKEPPLLFQAASPNNTKIIEDSIHSMILQLEQNREGGATGDCGREKTAD